MSSELLCRICSLPVYKSPTPHTGYYKVKSNGEIKDAQIDLGGERFHKKCAKCSTCKCYLLTDNFQKDENSVLFCTEHFVGNTSGVAVESNGDSAKAAADAEAAAEKFRIEAAEKARVEAEEKARIEAIVVAEKARVEAEEKARIEAIAVAEKARVEAEENARIEAVTVAEKARVEAEEKARVEAAVVAASAVLSDKTTISPPSKPPRKSGANDTTPRSPVLTARSTGGNGTARSADPTVNETTPITGVIIATTDESSKDKEPITVTHDDSATIALTAEQQAALELAEYEKAQAILAADALIAAEKEKKRVEEAVAAAEKARLEVEAKLKADAEIAARETTEAAAVALTALAAQKEAEMKAENTAFETGNAIAENAAHVPIPSSTFVSPRGEETLAILSQPNQSFTSEKNNTDAMEIGLLAAGATAVAAIAAVFVSSSPRVEPTTTESTTESTIAITDSTTAVTEAANQSEKPTTTTSSKVGGGILDRVKSFNQ